MWITSNRSQYWRRVALKYGYCPIKLVDGLTEAEAFTAEIQVIRAYKKIGLCEVNISLGGDGVKVRKRWWGEAISRSLKGMKRPSGHESKSYKAVISKEQLEELYVHQQLATPEIAQMLGVSIPTVIARLAEYGIPIRPAGRTSIPIRCVEDGKVFQSINDAARHYNLYRENIKKVLKGTYKQTGQRRFIYEQE